MAKGTGLPRLGNCAPRKYANAQLKNYMNNSSDGSHQEHDPGRDDDDDQTNTNTL